jgi:hypothetical protein
MRLNHIQNIVFKLFYQTPESLNLAYPHASLKLNFWSHLSTQLLSKLVLMQ